jgi:hypothetical protein
MDGHFQSKLKFLMNCTIINLKNNSQQSFATKWTKKDKIATLQYHLQVV